jgi:hypothetical protein
MSLHESTKWAIHDILHGEGDYDRLEDDIELKEEAIAEYIDANFVRKKADDSYKTMDKLSKIMEKIYLKKRE